MKKLVLLILNSAFLILNCEAQEWLPVNADASFTAYCFAEYNGELHVGFPYYLTHHYFSAVKLKDNKWENLGKGIEGVNSSVKAMAVYKDELYVAGRLQEVAGVHEPLITRWDGQKWNTVGPFISYVQKNMPYIQNIINCMMVYKDELYVGGSFKFTASGKTAWSIAKWNGKTWTPVGPGISGSVSAFEIYNDELYVAGSFMSTSGASRNDITWYNGIAKWDGTKFSELTPMPDYINTKKMVYFGDTPFDSFNALKVYNGELYAGGYLKNDKGKGGVSIKKWNGKEWSLVGNGKGFEGYINDFAVYNDKLFAVGAFTKANEIPAKNIAKWDGTVWSALGKGTDQEITKAFVYNNELWVTGAFYKVDGKEIVGMAKYKE
jgi:hypothetical protein